METISIEFVKGEVHRLLQASSVSALDFGGISLENEKADLGKAINRCENSGNNFLIEFGQTLHKDYYQISDLIESLDSFQLEQFLSLLNYYYQSLDNLKDYDESEKREFYLSLSFNLIRDINNYIYEYDQLVRKRSLSSSSSTRKQEVAMSATSFRLYLN